jgi:hypothetical protein
VPLFLKRQCDRTLGALSPGGAYLLDEVRPGQNSSSVTKRHSPSSVTRARAAPRQVSSVGEPPVLVARDPATGDALRVLEVGLHPIVTLEKELLNMIGNLV